MRTLLLCLSLFGLPKAGNMCMTPIYELNTANDSLSSLIEGQYIMWGTIDSTIVYSKPNGVLVTKVPPNSGAKLFPGINRWKYHLVTFYITIQDKIGVYQIEYSQPTDKCDLRKMRKNGDRVAVSFFDGGRPSEIFIFKEFLGRGMEEGANSQYGIFLQ